MTEVQAHRASVLSCLLKAYAERSAFLAALALAPPQNVPAIPSICSQQGGQMIEQCPESCAAACTTRAFVIQDRRFTEACDRLARHPKTDRTDKPVCRAPEVPATGTCLTDLQASPSLAQKLNQIRDEEQRETLKQVFSDFPSCIPEPALLPDMLACIHKGANEMSDLFSKLSLPSEDVRSADRQQFCSAARDLFEGHSYAALRSTEQRAGILREQFNHLAQCSGTIREWMTQRSSRTRTQSNPWLDKRVTELFAAMDKDLSDAARTQDQIKDLMNELVKQRRAIDADLETAILRCRINPDR